MRKLFLLWFILLLVIPAGFSQQQKTADASRKKKEQIDQAHKKAYEKARKKTLKHRREIQTKKTRERMDETERKALAYNRQNNKKWWQKIFKKHPRK